jgi:ribonuclease HI
MGKKTMHDEKAGGACMEIYTDGGCSGNPGPGGWAYVIIKDKVPFTEKWGAEKLTTNNRMELQAVIAALEFLALEEKKEEKIAVYTDSQYVQKGITIWLAEWKKRGWKTSDKKPVKNKDLWQRLEALAEQFPVSWVWVRGHAGNEYNERCDELTRTAIVSL